MDTMLDFSRKYYQNSQRIGKLLQNLGHIEKSFPEMSSELY